MSLNHLVERISVKRDAAPVVFYDEADAIEKINQQRLSQIGISVKKFGYQRKLQLTRENYHKDKENRLRQIAEYRKNNPDKVKKWELSYRERNKDYQREWRAKNTEKSREYSRKYKRKKYASMTNEQKKQAYQDVRAKMIEKHGLEGWRKICNERTKQSRLKKKERKNEQCV